MARRSRLRALPIPRPTFRGWALLIVGVGLVVAGLVTTVTIAITAGLLMVFLDLAGIVVALSVSAPLRADRSISRSIVEVGDILREHVLLTGLRMRFAPTVAMHVHEGLSQELTSVAEPSATVTIGPARPPARLEFEALAVQRGVATVGPLRVRVIDPFGLVRIDRAVIHRADVMVVPRGVSVGAIDTGALAGAVSADEGRVGQGGSADDSELRPYRPGDPIRRVHWAQSARRGELHVRQTTQAQPPEAVVALDTRPSAYQDLGRDDVSELADIDGYVAFEHAVVVAAGVARQLAARAAHVALISDEHRGTAGVDAPGPSGQLGQSGQPRWSERSQQPQRSGRSGRSGAGLQEALVELATVQLHGAARPLDHVLAEAAVQDPNGMTAVVTGHCSEAEALAMVRQTRRGARGLFVAIVPPSGTVRGIFERAGWRVITVAVPSSAHGHPRTHGQSRGRTTGRSSTADHRPFGSPDRPGTASS